MAKSPGRIKKKPYLKALLFGITSAGLYWVVFTHEAFVKNHWGKGGIYAVLPIATAFLFSFIHGSFTNHFYSVLGIEAKKK
ncbi:MAG: hypothetical protein QME63_00360 [Actinomycetota bacterium]|nr:hypothetical protein [Actinomycetota bacterium]